MDRKRRKSIFQLLPLDGRYFLTVALKEKKRKGKNERERRREGEKVKERKLALVALLVLYSCGFR